MTDLNDDGPSVGQEKWPTSLATWIVGWATSLGEVETSVHAKTT